MLYKDYEGKTIKKGPLTIKINKVDIINDDDYLNLQPTLRVSYTDLDEGYNVTDTLPGSWLDNAVVIK